MAPAFDKLESPEGPLNIQARPPPPTGFSQAFLDACKEEYGVDPTDNLQDIPGRGAGVFQVHTLAYSCMFLPVPHFALSRIVSRCLTLSLRRSMLSRVVSSAI